MYFCQRNLAHKEFPVNFVKFVAAVFLSIDSLATGRCGSDFKSLAPKYILQIKFTSISGEIALRWMSKNVFDYNSKLVRVMDWCHQPLPEPMLIQIYRTLLLHKAAMS